MFTMIPKNKAPHMSRAQRRDNRKTTGVVMAKSGFASRLFMNLMTHAGLNRKLLGAEAA